MTMFVCVAIRDRALDAFMLPFHVQSRGVAVRSFTNEVNKPDSPMNGNSEDYDLYVIGAYDDSSGRLIPLDSPECICRAQDVKAPSA